MGYNKLPLPLYLMLTIGLSIFLICCAVFRYKKDSKSLITVYLSFGIGVLFIALDTIKNNTNFLSTTISKYVPLFIGLCFLIGIIFMCYSAWNNKKNPNAKRTVIISITLMFIGIVLFTIAYFI
jgi:Na+/phosphate symporter